MTLIVCLSEGNGMLFNGRRQSRDRLLIKDIEDFLLGKPLFISDFSEKLFANTAINTHISQNPLSEAKEGDFVFIENVSAKEFSDKISELVIYRWNRKYPTDFTFDIDVSDIETELIESIDFEGSSHEKITRERWKKTKV